MTKYSSQTIWTNFKRALYLFSGFSRDDIKRDTTIYKTNECIKYLLNDSKMMEAKNHYTFDQRTQMTTIALLVNLFDIATDEYYLEQQPHLVEKIKELRSIIRTSELGVTAKPRTLK